MPPGCLRRVRLLGTGSRDLGADREEHEEDEAQLLGDHGVHLAIIVRRRDAELLALLPA